MKSGSHVDKSQEPIAITIAENGPCTDTIVREHISLNASPTDTTIHEETSLNKILSSEQSSLTCVTNRGPLQANTAHPKSSILTWLQTVQIATSHLPQNILLPDPRLCPTKREFDEEGPRQNGIPNKKQTFLRKSDSNMADRDDEVSSTLPSARQSSRQNDISSAQSMAPPSSDSGGLKLRKNPSDVGDAMERHGLVFNNKAALNRYEQFHTMVLGIIDGERCSPMKECSAKKFQFRLQNYQDANEDTLLERLIPCIVKDTYTAKKDPLDPEPEIRSWEEDNSVRCISNNEFRRTLLPNKYDDQFEKYLATALKKKEGMTNPKPDRTYGLARTTFPFPQALTIAPETVALLEIAPYLRHPFLILEGKGQTGVPAEAHNQARRGGATLVNAYRKLHMLLGYDDPTGADELTIAFSCTLSTQLAEIWIHWAEVQTDNEPLFHMNRLVTHNLVGDDRTDINLAKLRVHLHNIMEWGSLTRLPQLNKLNEKLHEHARLEIEKMKSSPRKRQRGGSKSSGDGTSKH